MVQSLYSLRGHSSLALATPCRATLPRATSQRPLGCQAFWGAFCFIFQQLLLVNSWNLFENNNNMISSIKILKCCSLNCGVLSVAVCLLPVVCCAYVVCCLLLLSILAANGNIKRQNNRHIHCSSNKIQSITKDKRKKAYNMCVCMCACCGKHTG